MNDIYFELQQYAQQDGDQKYSGLTSIRSSIQQDQMQEFRKNTERIRLMIQLIKQNNEEIQYLKQEQAKTTLTQKEKEIGQQLNRLAADNQKHTMKMKDVMTLLNNDIQESQEQYPDETETLAKIYQKRALQTEIQNLLTESQSIHSQYKQSIKKKIDRQIQLLDPSLSSEKRNELLEDPDGLQKVMQAQTLGSASIQLQNRVDDVIEKTKEIKRLEKTYEQCFQIMNEIAFMVQIQGEALNDIEEQLDGAKDYVQKANKIFEKEKKEHKKNRKKLCCIIFMGLLLVAVFTAPLWIRILRNKINGSDEEETAVDDNQSTTQTSGTTNTTTVSNFITETHNIDETQNIQSLIDLNTYKKLNIININNIQYNNNSNLLNSEQITTN